MILSFLQRACAGESTASYSPLIGVGEEDTTVVARYNSSEDTDLTVRSVHL